MLPLSAFPADERRRVDILLADIDDTMTEHGRLPATSYLALERLAGAGVRVIPVTGRPAGWCDMIARFWPVAGVVGENGAFAYAYDHAAQRMTRLYWRPEAQRLADRERLDVLARKIAAAVPEVRISADQAFREADLAIDFREDVPPAPEAAVARVVALFEAAGAQAKVSSIHVNGWFGDYDKHAMCRRFLAEAFGLDFEAAQDRLAYVGDSPNDAPMFAAVRNAVGVANVRDFGDKLATAPRYVTTARAAGGFMELAERLLEVRSAGG
jgi:HAD superfamily hydrolase (TIGR01484 family)